MGESSDDVQLQPAVKVFPPMEDSNPDDDNLSQTMVSCMPVPVSVPKESSKIVEATPRASAPPMSQQVSNASTPGMLPGYRRRHRGSSSSLLPPGQCEGRPPRRQSMDPVVTTYVIEQGSRCAACWKCTAREVRVHKIRDRQKLDDQAFQKSKLRKYAPMI